MVCVAAMVLAGCARAPAVERLGVVNAEITYLSSFAMDDPFARVIAGAIAEYEATSGNRVNIIWSGQETAEEVYVRHTGGARVDVWDGDIERQMQLNAAFMLDLTEFADERYDQFGNRSMLEVISPFLLNFVQQMSRRFTPEDAPDTMLAVPFAPYNVAFVYNQNYFASVGISRAPRTWDEFLTTTHRLRERGFVPLSGQMQPYLAYGYYLARAMGTDWVALLMDEPSMWTDPAVFRMATDFDRLSREGSISLHENRMFPGPHAHINDRVVMWLKRTSDIRDLVESHDPGTTFGAFNFPLIHDIGGLPNELPPGQAKTMHGAHGFFISTDTRYAAYAFEMIATVFSPNFDQQLSVETFGVPFAADIPWPPEIRGIEASFNEIAEWMPYGGGTLANPYTRARADYQFVRLMQDRVPARKFVAAMME